VPSTFQRGEQGDFLLRVFVQKSWGSSEIAKGKEALYTQDMFAHNITKKNNFEPWMSKGQGKLLTKTFIMVQVK
jgi:hypothetical protein